MDKTRKIILNIAGTLNLVMLIIMCFCFGLILSGNETFINSMLESLKPSLESMNVENEIEFLKMLLISIIIVYLIICAFCFVFARLNAKNFKKYRFLLVIVLVLHLFSASFISMFLVFIVMVTNWQEAENGTESVKEYNNLNNELSNLAREIESLKIQRGKGIITNDEYNKYVSEVMEKYASKGIDNGAK